LNNVNTCQYFFQVLLLVHSSNSQWKVNERGLALIDDFRTPEWARNIKYPEIVYQKSVKFLQEYEQYQQYAYAN